MGGLVDLVALEVAAMYRAHLLIPAVEFADLRGGAVPGDGDGLGGQVIDEALGESGLQVLDGAPVVLFGEVGGVDVLGLAILDLLRQVPQDVVDLLGHLDVAVGDVVVFDDLMSMSRIVVALGLVAWPSQTRRRVAWRLRGGWGGDHALCDRWWLVVGCWLVLLDEGLRPVLLVVLLESVHATPASGSRWIEVEVDGHKGRDAFNTTGSASQRLNNGIIIQQGMY